MQVWQRFKVWFSSGLDIISAIVKSLSGDPLAWESTIRKFEAHDRVQPPAPDAIVFTGSSSITFWSTLEQDMAPLPVINRGFGGSHMRDVVTYAPRIVVAYRPRAVVLFAGTNDIAGSKPKTAQEVYDGYRAFVAGGPRGAARHTHLLHLDHARPLALEALARRARGQPLDPHLHRDRCAPALHRPHRGDPGSRRQTRSQPLPYRSSASQQKGLRRLDGQYQANLADRPRTVSASLLIDQSYATTARAKCTCSKA